MYLSRFWGAEIRDLQIRRPQPLRLPKIAKADSSTPLGFLVRSLEWAFSGAAGQLDVPALARGLSLPFHLCILTLKAARNYRALIHISYYCSLASKQHMHRRKVTLLLSSVRTKLVFR